MHNTRVRLVFCLLASIVIFFTLLFPVIVLERGQSAIYASVDDVDAPRVVIVFGAGLRTDGSPSDALRDRLTVAAALYHAGFATRILVSGDNSVAEYNEPQVMHDVLVEEFGVPGAFLVIDYAGRRTYDTCARAHLLWGVDRAILVSQGYHLPRAIWTCEHAGIESTGVSASLQPYVKEFTFKLREVFAIYKAALDVYLLSPSFIEGEFEEDLDG